MWPPRTLARTHAFPLFVVLAFALSWYPTVLGLLGVKASGINPLGVFVAALIVSALRGGWSDAKALLARIVRWRVGFTPYAIALGLPLLLLAIAFAINVALGARPIDANYARWPDAIETFIIVFLFIGLGEEPGWRGFAVPELQRRMAPLRGALVLGVVWTLWHVPLMGGEFAWAEVPWFVLSVFAATIVLTWLFNRSNGSVLLPMLMHAAVNSAGAGYVFRLFSPDDKLQFWWIYAPIWAAAAALIAWRTAGQLGAEPRSSERM